MTVLPPVLSGNKAGYKSTIKMSFSSELFSSQKVAPLIIRFLIEEGKGKAR